MTERPRVLITGAAGRIGVAVTHCLPENWDLVATDAPGSDCIALDVTDPAACWAAFASVDAVVHLAAVPDPEAAWNDAAPGDGEAY